MDGEETDGGVLERVSVGGQAVAVLCGRPGWLREPGEGWTEERVAGGGADERVGGILCAGVVEVEAAEGLREATDDGATVGGPVLALSGAVAVAVGEVVVAVFMSPRCTFLTTSFVTALPSAPPTPLALSTPPLALLPALSLSSLPSPYFFARASTRSVPPPRCLRWKWCRRCGPEPRPCTAG